MCLFTGLFIEHFHHFARFTVSNINIKMQIHIIMSYIVEKNRKIIGNIIEKKKE